MNENLCKGMQKKYYISSSSIFIHFLAKVSLNGSEVAHYSPVFFLKYPKPVTFVISSTHISPKTYYMKTFLLAAMLLSSTSLFAQKNNDKIFKEEFLTSCIESATEGGGLSAPIAKEYCNCALETLLKKYTMSEISEIGNKGEEEAAAIMEKEIEPCLEDLRRKLKKQQEEE